MDYTGAWKAMESGSSGGGTRTRNPPVNSRMLCQLSYPGMTGDILCGAPIDPLAWEGPPSIGSGAVRAYDR